MNAEMERATTGVPGLDQLMNGGLPRDNLYLINGPSGAGKTTLALQFLLEGARLGERTLYIGTSESKAGIDVLGKARGWDMTGIEIRHHAGPNEMARWPEQTMLHPVEVELPRTMQDLMTMVEEVKPQRLVVDSLSEIRLLSREENWFRDQIKFLQRQLADRRCTVLLTDVSVEYQPVLRSAVHGVIELEQATSIYGPDRRRLRVVKMRGISHATGYHDVAIESAGLRVFPRLVAAEHRQRRPASTVSTGLSELDTMLGGGIDCGTSTLFLGPTGTGKSTLMTQYVVTAARRGEKSALYIFDERVQTVFQRAAGLGLELQEHVDSGLITVRQIDPVELTPGQFTQAVMDAVADGAQMVAIDSLNGYAYAMPEERLLELHMHELVSYLNQQGVTSLLIMTQHGLFTPRSTTFDVSYVADTVVITRPFEFRGTVRNALSVHKRRIGPHERTVREFLLRDGKLVIGKPLKEFSGVIAGNLQYLGEELEQPQGGR